MTAWRLTDLGEAEWLEGEAAVARFDALWRQGRRPRIEDHLPAGGPLRLPLLVELILTDLELGRPAGRSIAVADYLDRFPELAAAPPEALAELSADDGRSAELALPTRVGPYTLAGLIGRGAFAVVHRARHRNGTAVALKLVPADGDRDRVRLLTREAALGGRLRHPGIPRLLDHGQADGFHYLAHELVEGVPLHHAWERHRPTPGEVAAVVAALADAVDHAHGRGVVHRDLKPSNVILDSVGRPHLVDFGLAACGDDPTPASGERVGTACYMAPEQALGLASDARSDVWGLGVLLYEGLTGRVPFLGPFPVVLRHLAEADPVPPDQVAAGVPAPLAAVCLRALARRAADRYATAADLAADLRRWAAGRPVRAAAASPRRATRRTRAALVLLLVGLTGWHLADPAPAPPAALADPIGEHWLPLAGAVPPALRLEVLERTLRGYAEWVHLHPKDGFFALQAATVRGHLADHLAAAGRPWAEVRAARQREVDAWAAVVSRCPGRPLTEHGHAAALYCLADWLRRGGRDADAAACYRQSEQRYAYLCEAWGTTRAWAETEAGRVSPSFARWWRRVPDVHLHRLTVTVHRQAAEVALALGRHDAAVARARRALAEAAGRFGDPADRLAQQADAIRVLAHALLARGDPRAACDEVARVLVGWRIDTLPPARDASAREARHGVSATLHEVGRRALHAGLWTRAETTLRPALALREQLAGQHAPPLTTYFDRSATRYHLARALDRQGREAEAETHYRTALDEHLRGCAALPDHPHAPRWLPDRYRALADLLIRRGDTAEAEQLRRQAAVR